MSGNSQITLPSLFKIEIDIIDRIRGSILFDTVKYLKENMHVIPCNDRKLDIHKYFMKNAPIFNFLNFKLISGNFQITLPSLFKIEIDIIDRIHRCTFWYSKVFAREYARSSMQ